MSWWRIWSAISRAFPEDFRNRCGDAMDQAAADAGASPRMVADAVTQLFVEYGAQFWRDLRYALRTLAASRGFTAVAVVSLSLGICIATCAFSEMNGMVLRDLPQVVRADQLVALERPVSYPAYQRFRERNDLFAAAAAYVPGVPFGVVLNGHTERVWGQYVTPSYFDTFGVHPALGRFDGAVISYRFWNEHLGSSRDVIGSTLRINGQPVTIAGVAPRDFLGSNAMTPADLWIAFPPDPNLAPSFTREAIERNDWTSLTMVARLHPSVSRDSAEAALDAVARQFERDTGAPRRDRPGRRITLAEGGKCLPLTKQDKPYFTTFFLVLAGLVLLIACANVANMMLARAASRRREVAVRLALGASRGRIVRQLVTESLLVSGGAALVGAIGSAWLMHMFGQVRMPIPVPVTYDFFRPDARVLLFTIAVSLATGIGFGLVPALQATRAGLAPALKEGGNIQLPRWRRLSLRNLLMVSQVAGSLTLLVILGYLTLGIERRLQIGPGFDPANLFLISLDPTKDGYSPTRSANFLPKLLERAQSIPSIAAAVLTVSVPVGMGIDQVTFAVPDSTRKSKSFHQAMRHIVGKDYFAATGIPILAGRAFRQSDETEAGAAIIVSETLVRVFWPGEDPLGRTLEIGNAQDPPAKVLPNLSDMRPRMHIREKRVFEVVGVARDTAEGVTTSRPRPAIYFPTRPSDYAQPTPQGITLMVRARPGVDAAALVRREIAAMDTNVAPFYSGTMEQHIDEALSPIRVAAWTYGSIGIFGLVLAAVGLGGMTAYSVATRNHEIGIRMALGSGRGRVLRLVMKEGATLVGIGLAIGWATGWASIRGLSAMTMTVGQLATEGTSDAVVALGAPLLLASLAMAACYLPARRAASVDPAVVLRGD
jgi:predicted permease